MSTGPIDLVAWERAHAERCCQLAAACVVVYEHVLQFDKEVDYFWRRKWTVGKVIFLWSRYFTIAFVVGNASVFLHSHPSEEYCAHFFRWQNTGAALQVITTHLILEMRLYAMYRSNSLVICILLGLVLGESTAMGVLLGTPNGYGTNQAAPGVFICADGDTPGKPWIVFYYTVILITEVTLLTLSIIKAWTNRKMATRSGLLAVLTKDSVYYFLYLFWVYLGNLLIWSWNIAALNELGTGFAFALSAVFANRLMISLRESYYKQQDEVLAGFNPDTTLRFRTIPGGEESSHYPMPDGEEDEYTTRRAAPTDRGDSDDAFELVTFNERTGF
ncbi:hypothetical protein PENSPDRAFT_646169 [Peniophora sp. CONT]|nr:hypothetical protein PENSPDRAFT_646169 [Peniophora sp. CONT]